MVPLLVFALVLGKTQPAAVPRLVALAGMLVVVGIGLAIWGEQRWDGCIKRGSTNAYTRETGEKKKQAVATMIGYQWVPVLERCPDAVLKMRSPF